MSLGPCATCATISTAMVEEKVANDRERQNEDTHFVNPLHKGAEKIANGYIENYLRKTEVDEDNECTLDGDSPDTIRFIV